MFANIREKRHRVAQDESMRVIDKILEIFALVSVPVHKGQNSMSNVANNLYVWKASESIWVMTIMFIYMFISYTL